MTGTLFVVATPIGNLKDITLRAQETLAGVSAIICEDTRVTGKLLKHCGISKPLKILHEHTSEGSLGGFITQMLEGKNLAYVSDAGTPGVNDPGGKLVAKALESGLHVVPIPGPSALTAAMSVCGFPVDEFAYEGFVPHKKGRETFFRTIAERDHASIFFESTHRIEKTLASLAAVLGPSRLVFVGRELTKMHETLYRGTIDEVRTTMKDTSHKGEFVLIIAPKKFS